MRFTRRTGASLALPVAAVLAAGCGVGSGGSSGDPNRGVDAKSITLTIAANAVAGGKNADEAEWITKYVIPEFTEKMKAEGVDAKVTFQPSGVDDDQYKTKLSLDMKAGGGADIVSLDGIWVGEFADAGYIKPLEDVVGGEVGEWDGWAQIPPAVQRNAMFHGMRYGVPFGTDGRVLFYNKRLFTKAGLPTDWQPRSWDEILAAGRALARLPGVDPIQLNAGTAMAEATTMQGVLPLLAGTGTLIYDPGTQMWQGATDNIKAVLGFYEQIYGGGLGDPELQRGAKGRDRSFAEFAAGRIGILLEGDYFWRSVVAPKRGVAPMKDRDRVVGYALIPAMEPGAGINDQDFVSMSSGPAWVLNPNTRYPQQAWELLQLMNSARAWRELLKSGVRITSRTDVNDEALKDDPMLSFVSTEVLPITAYRPGLSAYPQVSAALQQATADIIAGESVDAAAQSYQEALEKVVGADHVAGS